MGREDSPTLDLYQFLKKYKAKPFTIIANETEVTRFITQLTNIRTKLW
jgi:hypothetical protein